MCNDEYASIFNDHITLMTKNVRWTDVPPCKMAYDVLWQTQNKNIFYYLWSRKCRFTDMRFAKIFCRFCDYFSSCWITKIPTTNNINSLDPILSCKTLNTLVEQIIAYFRRIFQMMIQASDLVKILYRGLPSITRARPNFNTAAIFQNVRHGLSWNPNFCVKAGTGGRERSLW